MPAARHPAVHAVCQVCGKSTTVPSWFPLRSSERRWPSASRSPFPSWSPDGFICLDDLNRFRGEYVQSLLEDEQGELTSLEHSVVESLARHETLAENIEAEFQKKLSLGERLADQIADFGGSWTFISLFGAFILVWMVINTSC